MILSRSLRVWDCCKLSSFCVWVCALQRKSKISNNYVSGCFALCFVHVADFFLHAAKFFAHASRYHFFRSRCQNFRSRITSPFFRSRIFSFALLNFIVRVTKLQNFAFTLPPKNSFRSRRHKTKFSFTMPRWHCIGFFVCPPRYFFERHSFVQRRLFARFLRAMP